MNPDVTNPVLDARGVEIKKESIVEMSEPDGPWSKYQGLVVCPNSDINGDEYTVAVYFYREVPDNMLACTRTDRISLDQWSTFYDTPDRLSKVEFLFDEGERWRKSPRVRFFEPSELVVVPNWKHTLLAERMFRSTYHFVSSLDPKLYSTNPNEYLCEIDGCNNRASQTCLYNVWGTVFVHYMCPSCTEKYHGLCGDIQPRIKQRPLNPKGQPVIPRKLEDAGGGS